jgi:hypothetical protein
VTDGLGVSVGAGVVVGAIVKVSVGGEVWVPVGAFVGVCVEAISAGSLGGTVMVAGSDADNLHPAKISTIADKVKRRTSFILHPDFGSVSSGIGCPLLTSDK